MKRSCSWACLAMFWACLDKICLLFTACLDSISLLLTACLDNISLVSTTFYNKWIKTHIYYYYYYYIIAYENERKKTAATLVRSLNLCLTLPKESPLESDIVYESNWSLFLYSCIKWSLGWVAFSMTHAHILFFNRLFYTLNSLLCARSDFRDRIFMTIINFF